MTDYRLSADPAPKSEVARADGAAELLPAPAKPVLHSPTPSRNSTMATELAEAREEVKLLRDQLHGLASTLHALADQLGYDTEAAAARARTEADMRRRFS